MLIQTTRSTMAHRSVALFSPAKVNLFLAVTGRREDGFHDLVSLVAPTSFGDTIWVHQSAASGPVSLTCTDPAVPIDASNLAIRAAEAFRSATHSECAINIELQKRIPMGAGLGGGSSNAAAVLRGLNALAPEPVDAQTLCALAAALGSDCPLFLADGPCVIRGRGEQITPVPSAIRERLRGTRLLLFKPDFSISTPWAYARLDASARLAPEEAESRLEQWMASEAGPAAILYNSFEPVVSRKFLAIAELLETMRVETGVNGALLTGSGSASLLLLNPETNKSSLVTALRTALGPGAFVAEAFLT